MVRSNKKLIVILGPTASGKSDLAVKLALGLDSEQAKKIGIKGAEIISADSRQVYKKMDIGTGKITKKEMRGIPHYLLDIASPKRQFTVAQYQKRALQSIKKIYQKNKIPILCGGTGFYLQAVTEGLILPQVKPDPKLRKKLEKKTTEDLFLQLKKLDPKRAKTVDPHNRRRLIRALEIVIKTKKPIPKLKLKSPFNVLMIGMKKTPQELKELINQRVKKMIEKGLEKETKKLEKNCGWKNSTMQTIGYQEWRENFDKKISKKEVEEKIKLHTLQFARRQMTWFKRDKSIHWIKNYKEAEKLVKSFLK